jgi:hypothetical protein
MRYYSARQAAHELLGWTGRRCDNKLTQKIKRKEKKLGRDIFEKVSGPKSTPVYRIEELVLRAEFPELFIATPTTMATEIKEKIDEVKNNIQSLVQSAVDKRLSQMAKQLSGMRADVQRINELTEKRFGDIQRELLSNR